MLGRGASQHLDTMLTAPSVNYRRFGNTSLRVSEIGLGCSRLGGTSYSDKQALYRLMEARNRGINFFDTADVYAQGRSEQLLGKAFKQERANVILATKAGYQLPASGRLGAWLKPVLRPALHLVSKFRSQVQKTRAVHKPQTFAPAYLSKAIEASLRRLQTDYLDIFLLHSPSADVIAAGQFVETLEVAKAQGKIRWYGVSCRTVDDAKLCLRYSGISAVQIPINLLEFDGVPSFLTMAEKANIAVIARQPFASGFLAQSAADITFESLSVPEQEFKCSLEQVKAFQFLELRNARTIAQASLEFVLRLPRVSLVLAGMNNEKHFYENLAARERPLSQEEMAQIYSVLGRSRADLIAT